MVQRFSENRTKLLSSEMMPSPVSSIARNMLSSLATYCAFLPVNKAIRVQSFGQTQNPINPKPPGNREAPLLYALRFRILGLQGLRFYQEAPYTKKLRKAAQLNRRGPVRSPAKPAFAGLRFRPVGLGFRLRHTSS